MTLRQLRVSAGAAVLCCLTAVTSWGHPTPYGDTYTFSGENFPNSFGVVKEPETGEIYTFESPALNLTFDGIAENVGELRINERAVKFPGRFDLNAVQAAGIDGQTVFELLDWHNPGEIVEFSFEPLDGQWIANSPAANSSFTIDGLDWLHAAPGATPLFQRQSFYFYWTNNGVPIANMSFVLADLGVLVGDHPFDPSVPEAVYIAYGGGQLDDITDPYEGGSDVHSGTRQLDANASYALLQQVLSIPPASGNGFHIGFLVDIDTVIDGTSGDFNGDDLVNTADYDILRAGFNQAGGFVDGDINFDGAVNLADFVDFRTSYQLANGQPLRTVPEPSTLVLAALACGATLLVRRRRSGRGILAGLVAVAVLACSSSWASAQDPIENEYVENLWVPAGPAAADWNVAMNWNPQFVPSQPIAGNEYGVINNGGRAYVDVSVDPAAGLILGDAAGESGALEIRAGGSLGIVQSFDNHGFAYIGRYGAGTLDVLPGGTFSPFALNVSGQDSHLNLSGNGIVAVQTIARLGRTTKISGGTATFTVGTLDLGGTLIAEISGGDHSPIVVAGHANLVAPVLKVEGSNFSPAYGAEYDLIDSATMKGEFASLDTSSAPALADGLQYRLAYTEKTASLKVDNTLVLAVDPDSGAASITNLVGASISLNGYSILSDNLLLDGAWSSLGAGWLSASPGPGAISETNISGAAAVNVGASLSIGDLFAAAVPMEELDLVFEYSANGELRQGIVKYGSISNPDQPGDTDGDGDVDITDLNNVRNNFGSQGNPVVGDTSPFDGDVNITDLNNVRNNFGVVPGGASAVPEPSTWIMASCSALALLAVVRRKR
ncbi:MAG: PEP-CTERM sorting domain-containing protein [Planctomycetia bacterium]|nr:PEP-CTERM sorting domain-containing protein [Planctomycetia bacterium]